MATATHEYRLNVRAAGKTYSFNFRQAFRFGHALLRTRRFKEASQVFEAMTHSGSRDPLAMIMLAYCKAGLQDYAASKALLCQVFADGNFAKADQLHTAFVYLSVGMCTDAVQELTALARECPDLPVLCLLLGNLLASQRKQTKAIQCWKLAVARDRSDGAVAATARRLVSAQVKQHTRT